MTEELKYLIQISEKIRKELDIKELTKKESKIISLMCIHDCKCKLEFPRRVCNLKKYEGLNCIGYNECRYFKERVNPKLIKTVNW